MISALRRTHFAGLAFVALAAISCAPLACTRQESPSAPAPAPVIGSAEPVGSATATAAAALAPPTVKLVGRFDTSDPGALRFAWSGSMVAGRFKGTGVRVRLKDEGRNLFQVLVDGEPKAVIKTDRAKETYTLASGLPDGVHDIAIYKRTEARVGEAVFLGFDPEGGTMLPPPPPAERRIELIGDSITAGYGNEGPRGACTFNPAEENQYATYGAVAARALKAEHVTIAWSGKTIGEMTDYYEKTLPGRPESHWDFKAWTPQLVVMNIGTNNFATYDPGETRYVRIYTNLFDRIRKAYPQALIVCMLGPMLTDTYPPGKQNLTLARRYMKASMEKIKASGETNFEYVELPVQKESDGMGCGFHPSLKTHKLMADRLVSVARARLGW